MKAKYIGRDDFPALTEGKICDVLSIEKTWFRVETDLVGDYLFPPELFEIVEEKDDIE